MNMTSSAATRRTISYSRKERCRFRSAFSAGEKVKTTYAVSRTAFIACFAKNIVFTEGGGAKPRHSACFPLSMTALFPAGLLRTVLPYTVLLFAYSENPFAFHSLCEDDARGARLSPLLYKMVRDNSLTVSLWCPPDGRPVRLPSASASRSRRAGGRRPSCWRRSGW